MSFLNWSEVLAAEALDASVKSRWKFAIMGFLRFCKEGRRPASITLIKGYLEDLRTQGKLVAETREALLWWVAGARRGRETTERLNDGTSGLRSGGAGVPGLHRGHNAFTAVSAMRQDAASTLRTERASDRSMPSAGAEGLGGPEWEQALVKAVRVAGLMWRTEQTYRGWAQRFVEFMHPRVPRLAEKEDVKAFLEELAVEQRASASSQKQAA